MWHFQHFARPLNRTFEEMLDWRNDRVVERVACLHHPSPPSENINKSEGIGFLGAFLRVRSVSTASFSVGAKNFDAVFRLKNFRASCLVKPAVDFEISLRLVISPFEVLPDCVNRQNIYASMDVKDFGGFPNPIS